MKLKEHFTKHLDQTESVLKGSFWIKPTQAVPVLKLMVIEDVTPTVQEEANTVDVDGTASAEYYKRKRRLTFNFFMMGLKEGDVLNFNRNDETCTVLNGRQVIYLGEEWFFIKPN